MRSFCVEMRILLHLPFLFCILFLGCTKLDPKIDPPAYLEITDYNCITDPQSQGTNSQKFTDVLVSTSTHNYGYYPIPCKIPLPVDGSTYLSIRPAILVNGVKFLRLDYPPMKGCDTTLPLTKGQSLKFTPTFKYFSTAVFPLIEDFEGGIGFKLKNSNPTDTFCTKIDGTNAMYGSKCLSIRLNSSYPVCQLQSSYGFTLPTNGPSTYLEFNYKSNFPIEVGLIGSTNPGGLPAQPYDQRSAGGANASASWNKIYIDLTNIVRTPPYYQDYFLYFYTQASFDGSVANPQIYIDNVKIVTQ